MPIGGSGFSTGTKAATAGTTFTITLSFVNTCMVIGVAIPGGSVTVSNVADGTNTYHRVSQVVLADLVLEVWNSDRVALPSGSVITVTLSATGTLAVGIARNYLGVAFAGTTPSTANGTTSPATSPSIVAQGDNTVGNASEWVGLIALNVNETLTQGGGALRGQVAVVGASLAFVDQAHTTPLSLSATFTDTEWIMIWYELRSLGVLFDSNVQTDAMAKNLNLSVDTVSESLIYQVNAS